MRKAQISNLPRPGVTRLVTSATNLFGTKVDRAPSELAVLGRVEKAVQPLSKVPKEIKKDPQGADGLEDVGPTETSTSDPRESALTDFDDSDKGNIACIVLPPEQKKTERPTLKPEEPLPRRSSPRLQKVRASLHSMETRSRTQAKGTTSKS